MSMLTHHFAAVLVQRHRRSHRYPNANDDGAPDRRPASAATASRRRVIVIHNSGEVRNKCKQKSAKKNIGLLIEMSDLEPNVANNLGVQVAREWHVVSVSFCCIRIRWLMYC